MTNEDLKTSVGRRFIDPPMVVEGAGAVTWDDSADVIVVGYGGAGISAALAARERGADVLAIDRFEGGGATAFSGGIIYAGATSVQREAGINDDVEEMYRYLRLETGNVVSSDTVRRYCEESSANLEWLIKHGVSYQGTLYADKTAYPPEGFYLYYSGNEQVPGYKDKAKPSARGHRAVGSGMTGRVMFSALRSAAEKAGVRRIDHAPVRQLVLSREREVLGVVVDSLVDKAAADHQAQYDRFAPMIPFKSRTIGSAGLKATDIERRHGRKRMIRAHGGVVLSTGGFVNNWDMMRQHKPVLAENHRSSLPMGSLACDGSGIELGRSAGGATGAMEQMMIGRNLAPPLALLHGVLVNSSGRRFINEGSYAGFIGQAIFDQPDGSAYLIVDSATMRAAVRQIFTSGWLLFRFSGPQLLNIFLGGTRRARKLEKLASKCGIDAAGLTQTIERYNAACAGKAEDEVNKSAEYLMPIVKPPFYAISETIAARMGFTMVMSLGGLRVNEETGEVIDEAGQPIKHLYAAGRAALGICSNSYISGLSIGDCVFSGRRAANHIMDTVGEPAVASGSNPLGGWPLSDAREG